MRIDIKYIDSGLQTFVDSYEMGREAAQKSWGIQDE